MKNYSLSENLALSKYSDPGKYIATPEVFGPGTWYCIHRIAYQAKTYIEMQQAAMTIKLIIDSLPCLKPCREEAQAYWAQDPATNHLTTPQGVFWWSVRFHNYVNRRLNKPQFTETQAEQLYGVNGICTSDCGDEPKLAATSHPGGAPGEILIPTLNGPPSTITPLNRVHYRVDSSPPRVNPNSGTWWGFSW